MLAPKKNLRCGLVAAAALLASAALAQAPPTWPGTNTPTPPLFNFALGPWPAENEWFAYTQGGVPITDPRTNDPSNGGTSPQSYVNMSSGCPDQTLPSIYVAYKVYNGQPILYFRWRVESAPNNYTNGGVYGSTNPWSSALYTVIIDINGDGYRDFAFHLDGSSGAPATPIDQVRGIYSTTLSQSVDYLADPTNIFVTGTNPAAFVDGTTSVIDNFQGTLNPVPTWPSGATVWDYGTTRTVDISTPTCTEYFVDYQIPIGDNGFFDARPIGGPEVVYGSTPILLGFVTSNSLNNSIQKDAGLNFPYTACITCPYPFGDWVILEELGTRQAPIVRTAAASGCGPATLTASVSDRVLWVGGAAVKTVTAVDFYYWYDADADGLADDAGPWTLAAAAAAVPGTLDQWTATWDSTALPRGQYLIGVKATDDQGNVTWSHLTDAQAAALGQPPNYGNPATDPGLVSATFNNSCGSGATIAKTGSTSTPIAGGTIDFTLTVANPFGFPITLSSISDVLPTADFTFASNQGGTLSPTTSPTAGSQSLTWTFSPAVTIAALGSETLVFRVNLAPLTPTGTYANTATAVTSDGTKTSPAYTFSVGTPEITVAKSASSYNPDPGATFTYSITVSNASPVGVTGLVVTDTLPTGLTFVSASDGGTLAGSTVTWNYAALPGLTSHTFTVTVTVQSPFPNSASNVLVNTATATSTETPIPVSTTSTVVVNVARPVLYVEKSVAAVALPGSTITWTIEYQNTGLADAAGVTITDVIPAGFTFASCTGGCAGVPVGGTGTVTWNIGALTVAAGQQSVTLTLNVLNPYTGVDPALNTATIDGTYSGSALPSASSTAQVAVSMPPPACAAPTDTRYFRTNGPPMTNPFPLSTTAGAAEVSWSVISDGSGTPQEVATFIDPTPEPAYVILSTVQVTVTTDRVGGNLDGQIQMLAYDALNNATVIASSGQIVNLFNNSKTTGTYTFTGSMVVPAGSRLAVRINCVSNQANRTARLYWDAGATGTSASRVAFCKRTFLSAVDKAASVATAEAGQTFSYTLRYSNVMSDQPLTNARVQDTLPAGLSFVSATLLPDGTVPPALAANCTTAGQVFTCGVASSANVPPAPAATGGTLAACGTTGPALCGGVLTVNVQVTSPLDPSILQLVNSASLLSTEAPASTTDATVRVVGPRLSLSKSVDQTTAFSGDPLVYTITVVNTGTAAANSVSIQDVLAGTLSFGSCAWVAPAAGTCGAAGQTVTASLTGSLAAGAAAQVTIDVGTGSVVAPATVTNSATATAQGSSASNQVSAASNQVSTNFLTVPNLVMTKSGVRVPAGGIGPGDTVEYTITLENTGLTAATNVLVTDPIPASTSYVPGSVAATSGTAAYDVAGNQVTLSFASLAPAASVTLTFRVVVGSLPQGDTTLTNTATVTAGNAVSRTAVATNTATATPALALSKSGPDMNAVALTTLTAPAADTNVVSVSSTAGFVVGDNVSIGGTIVQVTAIGAGTLTLSGNVTAASGTTVYDLATGGPVPFQLTTLTAAAAGTTVLVASTQYLAVNDYVSINGTSTMITAIAGNTLTVSVPVAAPLGTPVRPVFAYTLTAQNTGNAAASAVTITDVLPVNLTYVSSYPAVCGAAGQTVTCALGSIAAGSSGSVTVYVVPAAAGTYANAASVTATGLGAVTSNNVRTDVGGLRVSKATSTPMITNNGGAVATYTITVVNDLPATPANGVMVNDPLPTGMTYQAGSTLVNGAAAGDPAAPFNSPTWGPFVIAGGGTLTIQFNAIVAASVVAGTYQNPVTVTSTNAAVSPFDELSTTAEDVVVSVPADFRVTANAAMPTPCHMPCDATLSFTTSNVGNADGTGITVTIAAFDPSITVVGPLPAGVTQNGDGSFTWSLASLVSAANCTPPAFCTSTVTFNIQLTTFNSFSQCASRTASTPSDANATNDTGCAVLAPTRVSLATFGVTPRASGAEVTWSTAGETGTLGFHLYRQEGNAWVPVAKSLLPSLLDSPVGGSYRLVDAKASANRAESYLLVEEEIGGARIAYGPFRFGASPVNIPATPLEPLDFRPGLFAAVPDAPHGGGSDADPGASGFAGAPSPQEPEYVERVAAADKANAGKGKGPKKNGMPVAKIVIGGEGLTFLKAGDLATLLEISDDKLRGQIKAGRLALSNRGRPVAWYAASDLSGLWFWAEALHTTYTRENVYWLANDAGVEMTEKSGNAPAAVSPDQVFRATKRAEVDTAVGRGTREEAAIGWYWKLLLGGMAGYDRHDFPIDLEQAATIGSATLRVHLYGRTSHAVNPDHRIAISVNGLSVGEESWDGEGFRDVTVSFPASYLRAGANSVRLVSLAAPGIANTIEYIDSIEVTYPRRYRTVADLLLCRGDGNAAVTAAGFSSANLVVLDVTDPLRPARHPASVTAAAGGGWQATFAPASPSTPYVVTVASPARVPKDLRQTVSPSPLLASTNRADWVAVTIPALHEAASRLAARRQSQGLETQVVLLEDVMDAFNDGIFEPAAIRDFAAHASTAWEKPLRYLLLAGDGSYDYQNVLGYGGNVVPTQMVATPFGGSASDNDLGDVDGDGVPEVAVGRLPVLSGPELDAVTAKIAAYEDGARTSADTRLVLVADRPETAAGAFTDGCDDVASVAASGTPVEKVYRTAFSKEAARAQILADLRGGAGFLTFAGHSSLYWLSIDRLLTKDDVPTLGNRGKLPLVSATTCFIGAFQNPGYESLGERLVVDPSGGAAAVVSSSILSMDLQARSLTLEYHRALFDPRTPTVGDAFRQGLGAFVRTGGVPWMARTYVLLGDPATRTRVPGR